MIKKTPQSLPYRRGVGIVLVNDRGKVFVGERAGAPGAWQMPQGGIDKGETPRRAAFREMLEEIGTEKAKIVAVTKRWLRYELPKELLGTAWRGKYRGQEQKWFLMRFTGVDRDINVATEHPEFVAWKWLTFARLPRVIVPFKRELYKQVVTEFAPLVEMMAKEKSRASTKGGKRKTPRP
ncbi:MAG: RNA pyrophosphohydrolase [Rhodospirillaceae bacterium]|nr:MAG: RNA pyrophosphohydrolase [Rhodospirillaceae bacterium]